MNETEEEEGEEAEKEEEEQGDQEGWKILASIVLI